LPAKNYGGWEEKKATGAHWRPKTEEGKKKRKGRKKESPSEVKFGGGKKRKKRALSPASMGEKAAKKRGYPEVWPVNCRKEKGGKKVKTITENVLIESSLDVLMHNPLETWVKGKRSR